MDTLQQILSDVGYLKGKIESVENKLTELQPFLENKSKAKYYLTVISVLLTGVFGWLTVLTYCIIKSIGGF